MSLLINIVKDVHHMIDMAELCAIYFNRSTKPPDVTTSSNVNLLSSCLGRANNRCNCLGRFGPRGIFFSYQNIFHKDRYEAFMFVCKLKQFSSIFLRAKINALWVLICINPEREFWGFSPCLPGTVHISPRIKSVFTFLVLTSYNTRHCIKRNRAHTISIDLSLKPIVR